MLAAITPGVLDNNVIQIISSHTRCWGRWLACGNMIQGQCQELPIGENYRVSANGKIVKKDDNPIMGAWTRGPPAEPQDDGRRRSTGSHNGSRGNRND